MVAIKPQQTQKFLSAVPNDIRAILVYGTDAGLVSELAQLASRSLAARETPPSEILRIEDPDLEADPDRLIVELQTIPMFSGGKVVRTTTGRRVNANLLKHVFDAGPPAASLVIEAGNLKPSDTLRKLAESTPWAAALPCYPDGAQDLSRMVAEMVSAAGKRIGPDVRDLLVSKLGADRALSRQEVEKLLIFVGDARQVAEEDVLAIVGDVSELSLDRIATATADGRAREAVETLERAIAAGQTYQSVLLALQRHYLLLHGLASAVDAGKRVDDVLRAQRPPLSFSMRDVVSRQLRSWRLDKAAFALARIQTTIQETRSANSHLEPAATERLVLELARLANGYP